MKFLILSLALGVAAAHPRPEGLLHHNLRLPDTLQNSEIQQGSHGNWREGAFGQAKQEPVNEVKKQMKEQVKGVNWARLSICLGSGLLLGAIIGAVAYYLKKRKEQSDPETHAEVEAMRGKLLGDLAELLEAEKAIRDADPKEWAKSDVQQTPEESTARSMVSERKPEVDYEQLFMALTQKAVQSFGPKVSKGKAVKGILNSSLVRIRDKAFEFALAEVNSTVAELLEEVQAEEAMLLLDKNNNVATNFPPSTVLIAGLVSPVYMKILQVIYLSQALGVHLPVLLLCCWGVFMDLDSPCSIPTLFLWIYTQGALSLTLILGNLCLALKIHLGRSALQHKAEALRPRLEKVSQVPGEEMGFPEFHELFVCHAVILQQGLHEEDKVRQSFWHIVNGGCTMAWLISSIWLFVLVIGWIFVPGKTNFSVPGSPNYCGAWAVVVTARVTCVLVVLFLFINLGTVAGFISDRMLQSEKYSAVLLAKSKAFDESNVGLPLTELLVKAFVLRGRSEKPSTKLALVMKDKSALEEERATIQKCLRKGEQEVVDLTNAAEKFRAAAPDKFEKAVAKQAAAADSEGWANENSMEALAQAKEQAAALQEQTSKQLEDMFRVMSEGAENFKKSEQFQSALAQGQAHLAEAQTRTLAAVDQVQNSEAVQSALAEGSRHVSSAMEAAQQPGAMQAAIDTAQVAASQGGQKLAQAVDQAQQPGAMQAAIDTAQAAASQGGQKLAQAVDQAQQPGAMQAAIDTAQAAASQGGEKLAQAADQAAKGTQKKGKKK